jgi:tetratricopeptide (TPR) repeat protein
MSEETTTLDILSDEEQLVALPAEPLPALAGERVAFVGKLAGMSKREVAALVKQQGGSVADEPDAATTWIVVGESESPLPGSNLATALEKTLDATVRQALDEGHVRLTGETALWERLGLVEERQDLQHLHTPAMLAELLKVPVAMIRRWHRRGLIRPVREVRRLPYFDFAEVATARRLAELLAAGLSPSELEKHLAAWSKYLPAIERPLQQLSLIAGGKKLLARGEEGLVGPGGQTYFEFLDPHGPSSAPVQRDPGDESEEDEESGIVSLEAVREKRPHAYDAINDETPPEVLLDMAAEMEDLGELRAATDLYRLVLAKQGPSPEVCFVLADVLYRQGDVTAARERYAMAIELNEEYVEARANLGCVLAELGDRELAIAAFEGALRYHADYADVHYHLARALTDAERADEAREHWARFLQLAPDSPWAVEARRQLEGELTS